MSDAAPPVSEIYRQIHVSLRLPSDLRPAILGVTSAIRGEGRTTIALGLAHTLAADLEVPVALVEVDFEHPTLANHFGIPAVPGLGEVLRGERRLHEVLHVVAENLTVMTAGQVSADAARLLRQFLLRDPFHDNVPPAMNGIVILDLPPIINYSYSPLAASVSDATILVVRAGITPVEVVREAIARLEDRPPQGIVFNAPRTSLPQWRFGRKLP